eukprot:3203054-Pleurochrysis_carterae.AAC.1
MVRQRLSSTPAPRSVSKSTRASVSFTQWGRIKNQIGSSRIVRDTRSHFVKRGPYIAKKDLLTSSGFKLCGAPLRRGKDGNALATLHLHEWLRKCSFCRSLARVVSELRVLASIRAPRKHIVCVSYLERTARPPYMLVCAYASCVALRAPSDRA